MSDRIEQLKKVQVEGLELFTKKNKDYGDAFATYGSIGVLVRMGDKISRLQSINKNKIELVNDEKMRDTLIDLHNYAAMAIMLIDEKEIDEKEIDNEMDIDNENDNLNNNSFNNSFNNNCSNNLWYNDSSFDSNFDPNLFNWNWRGYNYNYNSSDISIE